MGCPLFCAIFILFWRFENHLWHCVEIIPYYYVECENCRSKSAGNKTVAHNLVPNNRFSDPDGLFLLSWFGIVLLFFLSKQLITQSRRHVSYALTVCTVRATSLFLFACDMSWIRGSSGEPSLQTPPSICKKLSMSWHNIHPSALK